MSLADADIADIAGRVLQAIDRSESIAPITEGRPEIGMPEAHRIAAAVAALRVARGERPLGWKIGFTNRTIWDEYGVHAPIWGPMYDTTFAEARDGATECSLAGFAEPRIEPEIALRIGAVPHPDMDDAALIACVDGVAHGVEVVQSVFPGWRFQAADTQIAGALHGCYRCGPIVPLAAEDRERWLKGLAGFEVALFRDGVAIDRGVAANVLGAGPIEALRHLVRGLAARPFGQALKPGDIVTTGTVTRAFPIAPGERWTTEVSGLPLPGLSLRFV